MEVKEEEKETPEKETPVVEEVEKKVVEEKEDEVVVEEGKEETEKEPQFLNPNDLPEELKPAFKKMQASFTRAMQKVAGDKDKVELYDKLMNDPERAVEILAAKVGLKVSKEGTVTKDKTSDSEADSETVRFIKKLIQDELTPKLEGFRQEQAKLTAQAKIVQLNEEHPDWYLYEDIMVDLVKEHPSLKEDTAKLYKLAKAMGSEIEDKKKGADKKESVITKTSSGRHSVTGPAKVSTLDDAFELAKKQVGLK